MQRFVRLAELRLAAAALEAIETLGLAREHLEHRQCVVPALVRDEPIGDALTGVDVIGIELEHALEELERARRILEALVGDQRGVPQQRDALAAAAARGLRAQQHLDGLRPVATLLVELAERLERGEVLVVERQRLLEVALRQLGIHQVLERDAAGFRVERARPCRLRARRA